MGWTVCLLYDDDSYLRADVFGVLWSVGDHGVECLADTARAAVQRGLASMVTG